MNDINLIDRLVATAWTTGRGGCTILDQASKLIAQLGRKCVHFATNRDVQREANKRLAFMVVEFNNFTNDF